MEEWRLINWIPELRGTYEVSNLGNVRRTACLRHEHYSNTYQVVRKIRNMTPTDNGNGYKIVGLSVSTEAGHRSRNFYVHRLVAIAFIANPENKPEVNHKDHNRENNRADNLEWVTDAENTQYSVHLMCHPNNNNQMRGIRLRKGKYEVQTYHKRKCYYIGRFLTLEEAIDARNQKDMELGII